MTQTTKRIVRKKAGALLRSRVSDYLEHRVENSTVSKVTKTVTARAAAVVDSADQKVQSLRKVKRIFAGILAFGGLAAAAYHKLNKLYSYVPKLKNANDKVASLTGVDIASKILPQK